ncbi:hypothetical protein QJQ45_027605 [Haematococcus lacustris]|nr:hypothetical protein QJQ45_027605 [Haematococcus lacustris]
MDVPLAEGKKNGNVVPADYEGPEYLAKLEPVVAQLAKEVPDAKYDAKAVATLVMQLHQFMEEAMGKNGPAKVHPKLPAKLLADLRPDGAVAMIASRLHKWKKQRDIRKLDFTNQNMRRQAGPAQHTATAGAAARHGLGSAGLAQCCLARRGLVLEAINFCRRELEKARLLAIPLVHVHASNGPAASAKLKELVVKLGGQLAESADDPGVTHVVFPFGPKGDPDDGQQYMRVLSHKGMYATVHWWYLPDSYDEQLPLHAVQPRMEPDKEVQGPWLVGRNAGVYGRWLIDSEKFNEWMNPIDYETEESLEAQEAAGQLAPPVEIDTGQHLGIAHIPTAAEAAAAEAAAATRSATTGHASAAAAAAAVAAALLTRPAPRPATKGSTAAGTQGGGVEASPKAAGTAAGAAAGAAAAAKGQQQEQQGAAPTTPRAAGKAPTGSTTPGVEAGEGGGSATPAAAGAAAEGGPGGAPGSVGKAAGAVLVQGPGPQLPLIKPGGMAGVGPAAQPGFVPPPVPTAGASAHAAATALRAAASGRRTRDGAPLAKRLRPDQELSEVKAGSGVRLLPGVVLFQGLEVCRAATDPGTALLNLSLPPQLRLRTILLLTATPGPGPDTLALAVESQGLQTASRGFAPGLAPSVAAPPEATGPPPGMERLHAVPFYASWFRTGQRHPHALKEARDALITAYRTAPYRRLGLGDAPDVMADDPEAKARLLAFLEKWGLINFLALPAPPTSLAPPTQSAGPQDSHQSAMQSTQQWDQPPPLLTLRPPTQAHEAGEESGGWDASEALLLLEGVEMYGESWDRVAQHVGNKTSVQCMRHFLQMPIEDLLLNEMEAGSAGTAAPGHPPLLAPPAPAPPVRTNPDKVAVLLLPAPSLDPGGPDAPKVVKEEGGGGQHEMEWDDVDQQQGGWGEVEEQQQQQGQQWEVGEAPPAAEVEAAVSRQLGAVLQQATNPLLAQASLISLLMSPQLGAEAAAASLAALSHALLPESSFGAAPGPEPALDQVALPPAVLQAATGAGLAAAAVKARQLAAVEEVEMAAQVARLCELQASRLGVRLRYLESLGRDLAHEAHVFHNRRMETCAQFDRIRKARQGSAGFQML